MPRQGHVEITVVDDSSRDAKFKELVPEEELFNRHDPDTFVEYIDPEFPTAQSPFAATTSCYIAVDYGRLFRLDITLHPGFNFSGWGRVKFDVFVDGQERGFVLMRQEQYQAYNKLKLQVGVLAMDRATHTGSAQPSVQTGEATHPRLMFEDPGRYLTQYASNAGSVIVEARLCNDHGGRFVRSNPMALFIFRYRSLDHLKATGIWKKIKDAEPFQTTAEDAAQLEKLAVRLYRPSDATTIFNSDHGAGLNWLKAIQGSNSKKRKLSHTESHTSLPVAKKQSMDSDLSKNFHENTPDLSLLQGTAVLQPELPMVPCQPSEAAMYTALTAYLYQDVQPIEHNQEPAGTMDPSVLNEPEKQIASQSQIVEPSMQKLEHPDSFLSKANMFVSNVHNLISHVREDYGDTIQTSKDKAERRTRILLIEKEFKDLISTGTLADRAEGAPPSAQLESRIRHGKKRYIELDLQSIERDIASEVSVGRNNPKIAEPKKLWKDGVALKAVQSLRKEFQALVELVQQLGDS